MKKLITFTVFIFSSGFLFAQFGINAGYRTNGSNNWEQYFDGQDFVKTGFKVGIDYWFRLKNKRIEFTPELAFSQFKSKNTNSNALPPLDELSATSQILSLYLNTNIYFLDLENDCNCPTWSKGNDFLKKGLFIQITPGLNYFTNSFEISTAEATSENDFAFSLGAGLGLDIGVSNMLTITPLITYHYYFNTTWQSLEDQFGDGAENKDASATTNLNQLFFGIRLGIRLDQKNYGFR